MHKLFKMSNMEENARIFGYCAGLAVEILAPS